MEIPRPKERLPRNQRSDSLSLTKSTSPSDLSSTSPVGLKKTGSSPISSNLSQIYHNLRGNDAKSSSGNASTGSNGNDTPSSGRTGMLKKLLNGVSNKSSEDLTYSSSSSSPPTTSTPAPTSDSKRNDMSEDFTALSVSPNASTSHDEKSSNSDLTDSDLQDSDVNASHTKSKDQYKIPSVFLNDGLPLLKISHKSKKRIYFKFDPVEFRFSWKSALNAASMLTSTSRMIISTASNSSKAKSYEFSIDDIKSLTYQKDSSNYREELRVSKEFENQWLSLIYFDHKKNKLKTLHVIADTVHDFKKLASVIELARKLKDDLARNFLIDYKDMDEYKRNIFVGKNDEERDKQIKEFLSFNDILKYSKRLNININPKRLENIFNQVVSSNPTPGSLNSTASLPVIGTQGSKISHVRSRSISLPKAIGTESSESPNKCLNVQQFKDFVSILKSRDDIIEIWTDICGGPTSVMTFRQFKNFCINTQREILTDDQVAKIFKKFCVSSCDYWVPENFNNYLVSKYSSPFKDPAKDDSYFNHPLNEYFISSSHNTYLIGRQVAGDSSITGYIKALHRGCRCVEVDVWDGVEEGTGSPSAEPIVSHGRTFTSEISFRNVMKTIKKYAFITTPFPLLVSLEINCSISNQLKVVEILHEILGEAMVVAPLNGDNQLPTPLEMKHRILIKAKKTSPFSNLVSDESGNCVSTTTSFSEDSGSGTSKSRSSSFGLRRKSRGAKIADELSDLGVYVQGIKFRNFSLPESKTFNHCFSLSEKSLNSMAKDAIKLSSVDKHNRRYLMRVYPSKMRLRSSNFMPIQYWSRGVQMVATNWQTYDLGQQINESMFEAVNKKGYVLKPPSMRKLWSKSENSGSPLTRQTRFSIKVISGHQLPKPKNAVAAINPFVTIEIFGAEGVVWDSGSNRLKTPIVPENGFNPVWNAEFSGTITSSTDLVFVRLSVNSSSSAAEEDEVATMGILVAKLFDLGFGYRYLPINDLSGEELVYSSLFLKIDYDSPIF